MLFVACFFSGVASLAVSSGTCTLRSFQTYQPKRLALLCFKFRLGGAKLLSNVANLMLLIGPGDVV